MNNLLARGLPSKQRQRQLSYFMEISLVGLLFVGLERGSVGIIVNAGMCLVVTQLPPILERNYEIPMDPRLTLWITSAAFLHGIGVVGIPGVTDGNFYSGVPVVSEYWDHITHALSSSVVAAVGYATVRAVDEHSEKVYLPPKFMGVIILLFVLAFAVLWELLEFGIGVAATEFGTASVLTQYGVYDTLKDVVYNSIGAVIVALWGGVYLTEISDAIAERLGVA